MATRARRNIVKNSLPGIRPLAAVLALLMLLLSPPLQAANPPEAATGAPAPVQLAWDRVGSPVRSYQV